MITSTIKQLVVWSTVLSSIVSCAPKDKEEEPTSTYKGGVFVVNEGPYGSGSGSISYYNTATRYVINDIFESVNQFPLGNIVQSINVFGNKAYIVVNQANKIEIVSSDNFKSVGAINNLSNPRNVLVVNNDKAYLTEWGASGSDAFVKVINTQVNTVYKNINLGRHGAEKMLLVGDYVYVSCKGGFGKDSVLSVISATTDLKVQNIKVGPSPDGMVQDVNGNIWVLCIGEWKDDYSSLEKSGRLVMLNSAGIAIEKSFAFSSAYSQPSGLCISPDKTTLYYNYDGKVYSQNIHSTALDSKVVANRSFYGLDVDPATGIIYASDPGNYSSDGKVIRYMPSGQKIDSFTVGVIPSSFFFN
jgi:hypothetical protein